MAPGRVGTTRIFILAVVSLFALLIVHNALNLDLAENASRRPGLLARRAMKASAPAEPPPARRGRAPRAAAPRPAGLGQPPAIAAAARLVDDPPWTTALLPHRAQPFDYSDCSSRPGTLGPTRALEYIVSPDDAAGFPANCEREDLKELCAVVRRVALNREVLTAVCNSNIIGQLEAFLDVRAGARPPCAPEPVRLGSHSLCSLLCRVLWTLGAMYRAWTRRASQTC